MSVHLKSLTRRITASPLKIFPLSGTILLPGCELPLNIFEPRYLNMVDDALKTDRLIGIVQPAKAVSADQSRDDIKAGDKGAQPAPAQIGTVGRIKQFSETDDGRYMIALVGMKRFFIIGEADVLTPYRQAHVSYDAFEQDADIHDTALRSKALSEDPAARAEMTAAMKNFARSIHVEVDWSALSEISMPRLVDQAAMIAPFSAFDKQSLLEAMTEPERRKLLVALMNMYSQPESDAPTKPETDQSKNPKDKLQ